MSTENSNPIVSIDQILPQDLFIVPIRFRPVFPGMVTPLVIAPGPLAEALENIGKQTNFIGLTMQEDDSLKNIDSDKLFKTGTASKILKKINLPEGGVHLLVNTLERFTIEKFIYTKPNVLAKVQYHPDITPEKDKELVALTRAVLTQAKEMMGENPYFTEEMKVTLINVDEPGKIADFVCSILNLEKKEYQEILETFDIKTRLEKTLNFLARELDLIKLQKKIQGKINDRMEGQQREYFLREQLRAIRTELGHGNENREKDAEYYRQKIEAANLPEEAKSKALDECEKLEYVDANSNEYGVIRNYLDLVLELPWQTGPYKEIDIKKARAVLKKGHFGLEDVKDRIIELLAVRSLKKDTKGTIVCLVGPPGVGKTSLGKSIAEAMGRKFFRFSLGGMRDEAEIKGHRKTYVGAMPGKIIQALKVVKSRDMVLMLDEIDKLGMSYQGDPASALLEALDPSQNSEFRDHFLDLPFDLSSITFITTANTLDSIPGPLLDRMEIIRLSGYILEEKIVIAEKYIIPRAIEESGLTIKSAPKLNKALLESIIDGYARESGVRSLTKEIQKIFRKAAAAIVENRPFPTAIQEKDLKSILGPAPFALKDDSEIPAPGCVIGLAWTSLGGATLSVEAKAVPGRGRLKVTGQLGKVMNESADIALTYAKYLVNDEKYWVKHDIHIHIPDGATPKDGPSAGITLVSALLSLYYNKKIKPGFAMTGEIRLTGEVLPIGGLKEKTIAARRVGIKKIIFPADNLKDWEELPAVLKKGIKIFPVRQYTEIQKVLF